MDFDAKVDASAAEAAFDALGKDGPRLVANALYSLAVDVKTGAQANAPGTLRYGWRIENLHRQDPTSPTQFFFGYLVVSDDKSRHGDKPVGRWVQHGTGRKADKRVIRDGNTAYRGQRAQRYLVKPSKAEQRAAAQNALVRAARRAGGA